MTQQNEEPADEQITELAETVSKYHIGCNLPITCDSECDLCAARAIYKLGYRKLAKLDRPDGKTALIFAILDSVEYELTHGACIIDKARVTREILALMPDEEEIRKQERERISNWAFEDCDCKWRDRTILALVKKKDCPYCWQALKEGK